MAHRGVGTIHAKRNFPEHFPSPFPRCFQFPLVKTIQLNSFFFAKMLKTCTCLSVKFVFSLAIAYEGPHLRGNLRNTIYSFRGFTNRKQTCKSFPNNSARPDCTICRFFPFPNLGILITSLLLFFNRSLEEGKIGIMKLGKARSTTTVHL